MGFLSNKIWVRIFLGHPVDMIWSWTDIILISVNLVKVGGFQTKEPGMMNPVRILIWETPQWAMIERLYNVSAVLSLQ